MINLIFYLIIAGGVGYFIYLFYKKEPFLSRKSRKEIEEAKLSIFEPKRFQILSRIGRRLWLFKSKLASKKILFWRKTRSRLSKKLKTQVTRLRLTEKRKFLSKAKIPLKKLRSFILSCQAYFTNVQKRCNSGFWKRFNFLREISKIKHYFQKIRNKFSFPRIQLIFKVFKNKAKIALRKEEDREIKRRLQKHKDSIVKPEFYLGELLKKFPKKRREEKKKEKEKGSFELQKEEAEKDRRQEQEKLASLGLKKTKEEWKPLPLQYSLTKKQNENRSPIEVSEESIKKIENKLISEILEDPKNIEAYKKLGKLYYNQFKYDYAKESFEAAIKLGSGDKKIKRLLKRCEEKLEKL